MKRDIVFVLIVMFVLAAMAAAQIATNTSMTPAAETSAVISMAPTNRPSEISIYQERQQVKNVVEQLDDAARRNDAEFFDRALAPDYVVSNSDSRKEDRDEIVSAHRNGDIKYDAVQIREQNIDVIGETAIERELADVRGSYKGRRFDGTYSTSRMWKRLPNGQWLLAAMQVQRVK
jgi:ketosteroid isomerase-like protein